MGSPGRGVDQLFGHDAAPLLHSALQRAQVSVAETVGMGWLQPVQQGDGLGVRVFRQIWLTRDTHFTAAVYNHWTNIGRFVIKKRSFGRTAA